MGWKVFVFADMCLSTMLQSLASSVCVHLCASTTALQPSRWRVSHHSPLLQNRRCQNRPRRSKLRKAKPWVKSDGCVRMPVIWKYSTGVGWQV